MLKKGILIAVIFIVVLSGFALAEEEQQSAQQNTNLPEGYVREESEGTVSIYNPQILQQLFGVPGTAAEAMQAANTDDGVYRIVYRGEYLGALYGTIVADVENKKIIITDGGFISPRTEINEDAQQESVMTFDESAEEEPSIGVRLIGKKVEIDVSDLPFLSITTISGRYAQHKYSFICDDKCRLTSLVMPNVAYLNVSGPAIAIKTSKLKEYYDGKEISMKFYEKISGLNEISVLGADAEDISLYASVLPGSKFGEITFQARGKTIIGRYELYGSYYDSIFPDDAMKVSIADNTNAILKKPNNGAVELVLGGASSASSSLDIFGAGAGELNILSNSKEFFLESTEEEFQKCLRDDVTCVFRERGLFKISPRAETEFSITYPAAGTFAPIEMLEIEPLVFTRDKITVGRKGVDATLAFTYSDISVANGNWLDLRLSFSAYVYDAVTQSFSNFRCDAVLKECYLDGEKVMGFGEQSHRQCIGDWECGEGQSCINPTQSVSTTTFGVTIEGKNVAGGRCVTNQACYELRQLNPSPKPDSSHAIDILLIPDGYGNDNKSFIADARKIVDRQGIYGGLLSVSPYKEYKNNFVFYTMPMTHAVPRTIGLGNDIIPHFRYAGETGRLCPNVDYTLVISKNQFRSAASPGISAVISVPDSESMLVVPHEFSHVFAGLSDEYNQQGGRDQSGIPNCIKTEGEARALWNSIMGPGNEKYVESLISLAGTYPEKPDMLQGCGGDCGDSCRGYFRPSYNSIMNHQSLPSEAGYIAGGDTFNPISSKWISSRIAAAIA
ncbi:MAG: M64 family metallopeptidase [Candidatus Nanoarchaeia archaeon]|nr:M64 family metallopeptidase [Candidatus Nanoarchaeia archaeon]